MKLWLDITGLLEFVEKNPRWRLRRSWQLLDLSPLRGRPEKKTIRHDRSTATCGNRSPGCLRLHTTSHIDGVRHGWWEVVVLEIWNWWVFLMQFYIFYAMFVDKDALWKPLTGDLGWMFVGHHWHHWHSPLPWDHQSLNPHWSHPCPNCF